MAHGAQSFSNEQNKFYKNVRPLGKVQKKEKHVYKSHIDKIWYPEIKSIILKLIDRHVMGMK